MCMRIRICVGYLSGWNRVARHLSATVEQQVAVRFETLGMLSWQIALLEFNLPAE